MDEIHTSIFITCLRKLLEHGGEISIKEMHLTWIPHVPVCNVGKMYDMFYEHLEMTTTYTAEIHVHVLYF